MRRWIRCPHGTMGRRKMRFRSETASLSLSPPDCDTCDIGGMPRRFAGHSSCADGSVALMERWAGEKCDSDRKQRHSPSHPLIAILATSAVCLVGLLAIAHAQMDPLPSWNDGPAKNAIQIGNSVTLPLTP